MESNGTIQFKGKCLDTSNGGTFVGTGVVLDKCSGATSQVLSMAAQPGSDQSSLGAVPERSQRVQWDPGGHLLVLRRGQRAVVASSGVAMPA